MGEKEKKKKRKRREGDWAEYRPRDQKNEGDQKRLFSLLFFLFLSSLEEQTTVNLHKWVSAALLVHTLLITNFDKSLICFIMK